MPNPISGRMPVAPNSRSLPIARNGRDVNMRLALEPGNREHRDRIVNVSARQFNALRVANQAIEDTHRIFYMGSGDNKMHNHATNGETFKRQLVSRGHTESRNLGPVDTMWEAKR